jgi:hypothetical protein
MHFTGAANRFTLFDPRTGEIWEYTTDEVDPPVWRHARILELGESMELSYFPAKPIVVK